MARLSWKLAGLNRELPIDIAALKTASNRTSNHVRESLRDLGLDGRFT
jgi:hypothetical protein